MHSADSIKEALPFDGKGIFLFDPPMGQNRIKPDEWKQFNASSKAGIGRAGSGKTGDKTVFLFEILGENLKDTLFQRQLMKSFLYYWMSQKHILMNIGNDIF